MVVSVTAQSEMFKF